MEGPVIHNSGDGGSVIIGTTVFSGGTEGSVIFLGSGGIVSQDNSNFFWNDTDNRLGLGTSSPASRLDIKSPGATASDISLRVRNSGGSYNDFEVLGNGTVFSHGPGNVTSNTNYGKGAMDANTTAQQSTAFGVDALGAQTTNGYNTGIGFNALAAEATSDTNTAVGAMALSGQNGGTGNTGVGYFCGLGLTTGDTNTFIGWASGRGITTGNTNIFVGYLTADTGITTGSFNTMIGSGFSSLAAGLSNTVMLADGQAGLCITKTTDGNVYTGPASALATNATNGFFYIPTCAGTPTGAPTAITGHSPFVVDSTNNIAYFYSGGSWRALN